MDSFERLCYTNCHVKHFKERLAPTYQGVGLATALATADARARLRDIVEAALVRDLGVEGLPWKNDMVRRVIITTEERDRWLVPHDEAAVLQFYEYPKSTAAKWAVEEAERTTPAARVKNVLNFITGTPNKGGGSKALIATAKLAKGEVAFLYRGTTLSSACLSEYEDHQPSVETDFATAYCWSEDVPGPDSAPSSREEFTVFCPVSTENQGTWAGYANDSVSLENALGRFMASQIARVETVMHQEGCQIPWLEQGDNCAPVGDRSSNVTLEPAVIFSTSVKDGKSEVNEVEFFLIGRASMDIEVGQEALVDYGRKFWDKQGTVVASMLDMALLQRRLQDAQKQAKAFADASLKSLQALLNVAREEIVENSSSVQGRVGRALKDAASALDACKKAVYLPCMTSYMTELEQCSGILADLESARSAISRPVATPPSQHLEERQSVNSCATADKSGVATTGGAMASAEPHPAPTPQHNDSASAGRVSLSKSRLRKGWTGGRVGLTHETHASAMLPGDATQALAPDRVHTKPDANVCTGGNKPALIPETQWNESDGTNILERSGCKEVQASAVLRANEMPQVDAATPREGRLNTSCKLFEAQEPQHTASQIADPPAMINSSGQSMAVVARERVPLCDTTLKRPLPEDPQLDRKVARTACVGSTAAAAPGKAETGPQEPGAAALTGAGQDASPLRAAPPAQAHIGAMGTSAETPATPEQPSFIPESCSKSAAAPAALEPAMRTASLGASSEGLMAASVAHDDSAAVKTAAAAPQQTLNGLACIRTPSDTPASPAVQHAEQRGPSEQPTAPYIAQMGAEGSALTETAAPKLLSKCQACPDSGTAPTLSQLVVKQAAATAALAVVRSEAADAAAAAAADPHPSQSLVSFPRARVMAAPLAVATAEAAASVAEGGADEPPEDAEPASALAGLAAAALEVQLTPPAVAEAPELESPAAAITAEASPDNTCAMPQIPGQEGGSNAGLHTEEGSQSEPASLAAPEAVAKHAANISMDQDPSTDAGGTQTVPCKAEDPDTPALDTETRPVDEAAPECMGQSATCSVVPKQETIEPWGELSAHPQNVSDAPDNIDNAGSAKIASGGQNHVPNAGVAVPAATRQPGTAPETAESQPVSPAGAPTTTAGAHSVVQNVIDLVVLESDGGSDDDDCMLVG